MGDQIPERLFTLLSAAALLAAVGALAWSGYEIFHRHLSPAQAQEFNFGAADQAVASERVGLDGVINAHIFGVVPPKPRPVDERPKVVEAPKTQLNLLLTGVITSPEPGGGIAMIEIQRGQTSVVRVGANIGKTGAKLDAVYADHILIERQGNLEKLPLERETLDLVALADGNDNTISSLNINVAEFEALAAVDPSETDISRLLPQRQMAPEAVEMRQDDDNLARALEEEQLKLQEQMEEQQKQQEDELERQMQELERQQEIQQQNEASLERLDDAGRKVRSEVPGGLKQI